MPDGVSAGQTMSVVLPSGAEVDVVVPDGATSGSTFLVSEPQDDDLPVGETVEVTVPAGVAAGESFSVQLADGMLFDIILPPGLHEGDDLVVEVPTESAQLPVLAEPPSPPPEPAAAPAPEPPASSPAPSSTPKRMPVAPAWEQEATAALASMESTAATIAAATSSASGVCCGSSSCSSPGGSRFNDRFSPTRQLQHFNSSSPLASRSKESVSGPAEFIRCRSDQLHEPKPEPGCRFYLGQPVQLLRSSGEWTEGTVLELPMPGLLETVYRCRLGDGLLEKMMSEDEVRVPTPESGFAYHRGQTVQIIRPNGLLELATVVSTKRVDRTGASTPHEPWYALRVHPSEVSPATKRLETLHEDELQLPRPQAGCAFYVGQLVHALRTANGSRTLCRVVAFERVGYSLGYKCEVVRLSSDDAQ